MLGGGTSGVKVESGNLACYSQSLRLELRVLKVAGFLPQPNKKRYLACTL